MKCKVCMKTVVLECVGYKNGKGGEEEAKKHVKCWNCSLGEDYDVDKILV